MNETSYRVDNLLRELGLYQENMTATDIINILKDNKLKYLTSLVDVGDINVSKYNIDKLPIDFGDLSGKFTLAEINELYKVVLDFIREFEKSNASSNDYKLHDNFKQFTQWNICKVDEVNIEITIDIGDSKYPIGKLYKEFNTPPNAPNSIAKRIFNAIYTHEKADTIKTGQTIVNLKFKVSQWEVRSLSPDTDFMIIRTVNFVMNALRSRGFDVTLNLVNMSKVYGAFKWVFELYEMTKQAYAKFISYNPTDNLPIDKLQELDTKAKKEVLIDRLGIKVGDLVLFSLVQFSEACRQENIAGLKYYNPTNDTEFTDNGGKRELSAYSVFLGKVINITKEYLVLRLRYCSGGKWSFVDFPVKWSILLPRLNLASKPKAKGEYSVIDDLLSREAKSGNFFNYALDVPILLTSKNCSFLNYPTNIVIESNF